MRHRYRLLREGWGLRAAITLGLLGVLLGLTGEGRINSEQHRQNRVQQQLADAQRSLAAALQALTAAQHHALNVDLDRTLTTLDNCRAANAKDQKDYQQFRSGYQFLQQTRDTFRGKVNAETRFQSGDPLAAALLAHDRTYLTYLDRLVRARPIVSRPKPRDCSSYQQQANELRAQGATA